VWSARPAFEIFDADALGWPGLKAPTSICPPFGLRINLSLKCIIGDRLGTQTKPSWRREVKEIDNSLALKCAILEIKAAV